MEEIESRHKKERKFLENEKRQVLKKIKGTAGKSSKAKELLAEAEKEWETKERDMIQRHLQEIEKCTVNGTNSSTATVGNMVEGEMAPVVTVDDMPIQDKAFLSKKVQKRIQQRHNQMQKEAALAHDNENSGPSQRDIEMDRIYELYLNPLQMKIHEIKADGNCLYRAVAHQLEISSAVVATTAIRTASGSYTYQNMRRLCADTMLQYRDEFEPFAILADHSDTTINVHDGFEAYVEQVRHSNEWGGHLELRALALALDKVIVIYSADSSPLHVSNSNSAASGNDRDEENVIRLSFHRSFYALGEHYNSVVPI